MNQEQLQYVQDRLQRGVSTEEIRDELLAAGYNADTITELLLAAEGGASGPPPASNAASLPDIMPFVKQSWAVIQQRPDVAWPAVAIVTGFAALPSVLQMVMTPGSGVELLVAVIGLISGIVSTVLYIAILKVFFSDESMSLADGLRWAGSHFFSYLWVAILAGLVGVAGFMLFVIPGIIAGMYLLLAPVVWMREDIRGVGALVRSTTLVQGHWWAVFGRYLVFILSAFLLMLVAGFVFGFVGALAGLESNNVLLEVLTAAVSGVVLVASVGALFQIYNGLKDTKPAFVPEQHSGLRTFYIVAAWLSPFVITFVLLFFLASLASTML